MVIYIIVISILVILLHIKLDIEYDIFNNIGIIKISVFFVPIIYFKVNIYKQFLVFTTSKKTYQLALKLNKEDIIFVDYLYKLFIKHSYGLSMKLLVNIGYKDSYDVVRIYSIMQLYSYYFLLHTLFNYEDITVSKNIFYSFTNNKCKIRLQFCFLINILDVIYIISFSFYKRLSYVKKYKEI